MMYKACSKCGKIHGMNEVCYKGRAKRTDKQNDIRQTNQWRKKSLEVREAAEYLCELCRQEGRYNSNHLEVHHIVPLVEDPTLAYEDSNLICLCNAHHREADAGKIKRKELQQIAQHRQRKAGV